MSNPTLVKALAIVLALIVAGVVTISFGSTGGRLLAYTACAFFAAAPFCGQYAFAAFAAFALLIASAVIVGRREWQRRE